MLIELVLNFCAEERRHNPLEVQARQVKPRLHDMAGIFFFPGRRFWRLNMSETLKED